jgi:carbonic anhydrase
MDSKQWKLVYDDNLVRVQCALADCSSVSFGSIQLVGKEGFEGKELQFHTPSDHVIGGKRYDLEVQAIYESTGKGGMGDEKAVLSMLFVQEPGRTNDFMQALDLTRIANVV